MNESLGGIKFSENIKIFIKWRPVADGNVLLEVHGSLGQILQKIYIFGIEMIPCQVDGGGCDWIEGLNKIRLADGFVMVPADQGEGVKILQPIDNLAG